MKKWIRARFPSLAQEWSDAKKRRLPFTDDTLPPEVLSALIGGISGARVYLEYGCGFSTLEALKRAELVVSVENDQAFLRHIEAQATPYSSKFVPVFVHTGRTLDWGFPRFTRPTPRRIERWKSYPVAPWRYYLRGNQPDFIFIDGRFRVACALECLLRASCRILFDDFVGREALYSPILEFAGEVKVHGRALSFTRSHSFDQERCRAVQTAHFTALA